MWPIRANRLKQLTHSSRLFYMAERLMRRSVMQEVNSDGEFEVGVSFIVPGRALGLLRRAFLVQESLRLRDKTQRS